MFGYTECMPRSFSPDDYDRNQNDERESALEARAAKTAREHAAPFAASVAIKRYADSDASTLERIALTCSAAFCAPVDEDETEQDGAVAL